MKKQIQSKSLKLDKEIVRALDATALQGIAGGIPSGPHSVCETGRKTQCC